MVVAVLGAAMGVVTSGPAPAAIAPLDWGSLGGVITSAPEITQLNENLHFFARGSDGALWMNVYGPSQVGQWSSLGGKIVGGPGVASTYTVDETTGDLGAGRIDVVARGTDNAIWHRFLDSSVGTWSPWQSLGGFVTSEPALHAWGDPFIDSVEYEFGLKVLARGRDGALWHRAFYATTGWEPWTSLGGQMVGGPGAGGHPYWYGTVSVRGVDNAMWFRVYDFEFDEFGPWTAAGGAFTDDPGAEYFCTPALFGRGRNGGRPPN